VSRSTGVVSGKPLFINISNKISCSMRSGRT
jgi:hypothetical protein